MPRDLDRLTQRHQRIAELYLAGQGPTVIARELDLLPNSVSRIITSPLFQELVARRRRELQLSFAEEESTEARSLREKLLSAGKRAVGTLEDLLSSESEGMREKSASAILAHAFKLPEVEASGGSVAIGSVNIQLLQTALLEAQAPVEGEVVEAESAPAGVSA